tara:strand:- start:151 stop:609 length:459 start_codon:yes stop_codon:yes gene_type:complete
VKLFVKFMSLALIAAIGGLFFIKGPNGQPLLTFSDLKPETPQLPAELGEPTTVYKWKDENGVWQFSSEPVEGVDASARVEKMELSGDINTVPAFREPRSAGSTKPQVPSLSGVPPGLTTVSPDKVEELTQAAQQIEETAALRKQQIDEAVGR